MQNMKGKLDPKLWFTNLKVSISSFSKAFDLRIASSIVGICHHKCINVSKESKNIVQLEIKILMMQQRKHVKTWVYLKYKTKQAYGAKRRKKPRVI